MNIWSRCARWLLPFVAATLALGVTLFAAETSRKSQNQVKPVYPELARKMNIKGTVKVLVTIAPNGNVTGTKVVGGHPLLTDAAVDAVKKWKFEAASSESSQIIEFNFGGQ